MTPTSPSTSPPVYDSECREFPYGWRFVKRPGKDGREELVQVPLTLEDALHPQDGDHIPQRLTHVTDFGYLKDVLEHRTAGQGLLLCDCIVDWNVPGVFNHCPDFVFFPGVERRPGDWDIYYVAWDGVAARWALEITSPNTRINDVERKLAQYHQVGIPLYLIVDRYAANGPEVRGYHWTPDGYVRLAPDAQGRLLVEPVNLLLKFENDRVVALDAETEEECGDYAAVLQALEEAEERARQQAEARKAAEERERQQTEARKAAERKAQDLAERLRQVEEELARLRRGE
jgi:colicin import membrane protein